MVGEADRLVWRRAIGIWRKKNEGRKKIEEEEEQ